ncbi:MAG: hypothetical protein M3Z09_11550 [Acidobacteriota bacterium]|nr:hypothetical protein [Acidobacteriota bacterium]
MQFPRVFMARQKFPDRSLSNIPDVVRKELSSASFQTRLKPGSRIAIGVGSRGIANIATIVRAVVQFWKDSGMHPFIFPAMGSHGAATAEGQADVLAHYGIIEETMGCPVVSSLEVVSLGNSADGIETFMDRNAFNADGVMLVGRVKWHTDFAGKIESGLFKMMAIGLGKFHGAQRYHTYAFNLGLERVILSIGRQVLSSGKILGGLAILEDANHNTAQLTAVPVESMEQREEELLALVKSWMAHLPVSGHILILDQIGKPISGAGFDTKVANRGVHGQYNPWPDTPTFTRLFIRDLHPNSYGNGVGLGMADVVSDRLLSKIDWTPTRINSLTASTPAAIRTPLHFPSDRECLATIAPTVGLIDLSELRICWVKNTLELNPALLSENLRSEVERNPAMDILSSPIEMPFDSAGNLDFVFSREEEPVGAH